MKQRLIEIRVVAAAVDNGGEAGHGLHGSPAPRIGGREQKRAVGI